MDKSINRSINRSTDKSVVNSQKNILRKNRNIIKIKKMKTLNLKVAQFNVMRYRIDQIHKRNPKLYMTNASYSKQTKFL